MLSIKLHFLGEVKKFSIIKSAFSFALLGQRVNTHFGPAIGEAFDANMLKLKYRDGPVDSVTIESEVAQTP